MTNFEFFFSLFGLLLGLSLAEVLGGFAKAVKRHGRHRLGLLTPMLSVFLLYDITTFWLTGWRMRDAVPIHIGTLILTLAVAGLYYFAAVLVWPEDASAEAGSAPSDWDNLDGWTLRHKRPILLSVFTCNVIAAGSAHALVPESFRLSAVQYTLLGLYFAGILTGAFVRGRRPTLAVLTLLLILYALDLFVNVSGG